MNIRLITLSAVTSVVLTAATPMVSTSMSTDNGGTKSAIDAYSDGGGVVIINQAGDTKFDNSAMNGLVFKYGQAAEDSGTTLKNQVTVLSADATASEKAVSVKFDLAKVVINPPVNGTTCDDGDPQTVSDVWTNGLCAGNNVENQLCDDGNPQTITDKYMSGVCIGIYPISCKQIKEFFPTSTDGIFTIDPDGNSGSSEYPVYCNMSINGGGWTMNIRLNTTDSTTRRFDDIIWSSGLGLGNLNDTNDFASAFTKSNIAAKEIMLEFFYSGGKIIASYQNQAITNDMFALLNSSPSINNPDWTRVYTNNAEASAFFGSVLSLNVDLGAGDSFKLWYNTTAKGTCNQTGGIGSRGDNYAWWIEAGFTSAFASCQENVYRSYLGSNKGGAHPVINDVASESSLSPSAIYSTNIIKIYSR